ncbi:MAG: AraC family transcriptional regulator, partial [Proteobacteria bacterium]|nr:AraC family transcriptional regulator [Pseudomonadota bacterium]
MDEFHKYLPTSQFDFDWGVYVTGVGHASVQSNSNYPPTRHPPGYQFKWEKGRVLEEFQILYIPRGSGKFESKYTGRKTVRAGTCILLFPGVWHRYKPSQKTGWDEFWIGFTGDYCNQLIKKGYFKQEVPLLDVEFNDDFLKHFLRIQDNAKEERIGFQQVIASEVILILAKVLAGQRSSRSGGVMEEAIKEAKYIMLERMYSSIDMQDLAKSLNLGYEHFRRSFKSITGLAPQQYYLELKLNGAKELLNSSNQSIKYISLSLGFENPYYFSKWFKKKTGFSPQNWRFR